MIQLNLWQRLDKGGTLSLAAGTAACAHIALHEPWHSVWYDWGGGGSCLCACTSRPQNDAEQDVCMQQIFSEELTRCSCDQLM